MATKKARPRKASANKGGRPLIGKVRRIHISLTVTPKTHEWLKKAAKKGTYGTSAGLVVDRLVESAGAR